MKQFSKKPWSHGKAGNGRSYVFAADNFPVLCVSSGGSKKRSATEMKANLKLAAAAPELLEALEFCCSVIKANGLWERSEQIAMDLATTAIKKAT